MFVNGTLEGGVNDVSEAGTQISVAARFEDGRHNLYPGNKRVVAVTRFLDGDEMVWRWGPWRNCLGRLDSPAAERSAGESTMDSQDLTVPGEPARMRDVEVLLFDVGGTVFDWDTAIVDALATTDVARIHAIDMAAFSAAWRERSLIEMYEIADLDVAWRPFRDFIETSLDVVLQDLEIAEIGRADREILLEAWRSMPVWPGARDAVASLRSRYFVAPHTIIGLADIAFSSKRAGIDWDAIISCDALGVTKTNPASYAAALDVLGVAGRRVCYVAAHPVDLRAAREHGMRTAYVVAQLHDYGDDYEDTGFAEEFDVVADDFTDLARQLLPPQ